MLIVHLNNIDSPVSDKFDKQISYVSVVVWYFELYSKKVREYDQEIPLSQTEDKPMAS